MKKFDLKILEKPTVIEQNTVEPHTNLRTDKAYCFEGENPTAVYLNGNWKFNYSENQNDFEGFIINSVVDQYLYDKNLSILKRTSLAKKIQLYYENIILKKLIRSIEKK